MGRDYSVVVLDNFYSGSIDNLRDFLNWDGSEVVEGYVRDKAVARKVMGGADAVVYLAD